MSNIVIEQPKKHQTTINFDRIHAVVMNNTNEDVDNLKELRKLFKWGMETDYGKVIITKEMADKMLIRNNRNRKLIKSSLEKYKTSLIKGDFTLSNDAISFNNKGELVNGQHRLKAISETGISLESLVALGVEQSSEMDRGAKRNIVDNIVITGNIPEELVNANIIKVCKALYDIIHNRKALVMSDLEDFINENSEAISMAYTNNLLTLQGKSKYVFNVNVAAAFLAAVIYYNNHEYENIEQRISQLIHIREVLTSGIVGRDTENDKIIIKLRDKLKEDGNSTTKLTTDSKFKCTEYCIYSNCNELCREKLLCKKHYYVKNK